MQYWFKYISSKHKLIDSDYVNLTDKSMGCSPVPKHSMVSPTSISLDYMSSSIDGRHDISYVFFTSLVKTGRNHLD